MNRKANNSRHHNSGYLRHFMGVIGAIENYSSTTETEIDT